MTAAGIISPATQGQRNPGRTIDGRKYYFYSNGKMAVGWSKIRYWYYYYFEETKTSRFKEPNAYQLAGIQQQDLLYETFYRSDGEDGTYSIGGKESIPLMNMVCWTAMAVYRIGKQSHP